MTFADKLAAGIAGESLVANWLRRKGVYVLPAYEKVEDDHKGPRLLCPAGELVAPDFLAFRGAGMAWWVEAKTKTAFTWHRMTSKWTTGIDLHHYGDYCRVADQSPWPVWLLFLQRGGAARGDGGQSPAGLYGNDLAILRQKESHRHDKGGPRGMVYWSIDDLRVLAGLDEVLG